MCSPIIQQFNTCIYVYYFLSLSLLFSPVMDGSPFSKAWHAISVNDYKRLQKVLSKDISKDTIESHGPKMLAMACEKGYTSEEFCLSLSLSLSSLFMTCLSVLLHVV